MIHRAASADLALLRAGYEELVLFGVATALPAAGADGAPPAWITLFPSLGPITTRDGRRYDIDASSLIAAFQADGIDLPVDVNHATDLAAPKGERADAVAWLAELRIEGGALQARVDWLDEGRSLLAARKYRYVSPSFWEVGGRATRLKAVALVTAPALGRMPALAGAGSSSPQETSMKSIATALGLTAEADETACLTALTTLKAGSVAKDVHDATLAQLSATSTELTALKAERRQEKVAGVLDGALKAKKIVPAQREHYEQLCSTDDGLAAVEKLIAATATGLGASTLDDRRQPTGGGEASLQSHQAIVAEARKVQAETLAAGSTITWSDAVTLATQRMRTAA